MTNDSLTPEAGVEEKRRSVRDWLEDALGRYQVTHIHSSVREALKEMDAAPENAPISSGTDAGGEMLLPCPFCGKQPKSKWYGCDTPGMEDCGYWGIDCCLSHSHSDSEEEAAEKWNRRTVSPLSISAPSLAVDAESEICATGLCGEMECKQDGCVCICQKAVDAEVVLPEEWRRWVELANAVPEAYAGDEVEVYGRRESVAFLFYASPDRVLRLTGELNAALSELAHMKAGGAK